MPYGEIEVLEELFTNGHYLWVSKVSTDDGVRGSWYCDLGEVQRVVFREIISGNIWRPV
jgi:hypothetical protein